MYFFTLHGFNILLKVGTIVFLRTVSMKYLTIISGQMHLLHQFKSDFAHLLALDNLVIELPNAKK